MRNNKVGLIINNKLFFSSQIMALLAASNCLDDIHLHTHTLTDNIMVVL